MLSANTVAQNPAGTVMPPLSPAHVAAEVVCVLLAVLSVFPLRSVFAQAAMASVIKPKTTTARLDVLALRHDSLNMICPLE
jgi:hypothetical protein